MTLQQQADQILTRPTVREICAAHGVKTLDEQDALLVQLWEDRQAMVAELKGLRWTVGAIERLMGKAIDKAEAPR